VKYIIRDDDINYFTKPEEIIGIYSSVWDDCPVSLSVTPFQWGRPAWLYPDATRESDEIYSLAENKELLDFLRDGCARNRLTVMMHGFNHDIPSGEPEFWAGEKLHEKARMGKSYLEGILNRPVKYFVPPHNSISRDGIAAVVGAGMNIVGIQSFRYGRRTMRAGNIIPFITRNIYLRILGEEYPWPLWVTNHWEIPYCTLGPAVSPDMLRKELERAMKRNGCFCLSTHYWELNRRMTSDPSKTVKEIFDELWEIGRSFNQTEYCAVDDLIKCSN
jgi:hypothetical protein